MFEHGEAAISFLCYTLAVFVLAILSHQLLQKKSFLKEYFIGSRGLGVWALAMSYAATSASGGSFTGFPALIHTHGWVLALWISSYMVVPICAMGMLGKRINHMARKTGAITVPDLLRDRFQSPALGILSSLFLVAFLAFNLVAQFKAGAVIIEKLVGDVELYKRAASGLEWMPAVFSFVGERPEGSYCLALLIFAVAVVGYTVYGGFRAVVWTDVLQGIVMFFGVLILLGCTLGRLDNGLEGVTRDLARHRFAIASLAYDRSQGSGEENFLRVPAASRLDVRVPSAGGSEQRWALRLEKPAMFEWGEDPESANVVEVDVDVRILPTFTDPAAFPQSLPAAAKIVLLPPREGAAEQSTLSAVRVTAIVSKPEHSFVSAPGFGGELGFLPFSIAISFFVMWAISGTGQPTTMVRLMAFSNTQVLRRAVFSVSIYYTLIYIPLVIIFVCSRYILEPLERPDEAMAAMVLEVVPGWLGGVIMAAPFAAIMSTVDSFLLAIASGLVRDIYQRSINPHASPQTLRRLSYLTTLFIGVVVFFGALNPPRFLQYIIITTSSVLSSTFLFPIFFGLYWKRMNRVGALCGMIIGGGVCFAFFALSWAGYSPQNLGGFAPVVWGFVASVVSCVVGSLISAPPPRSLVNFYFAAPASRSSSQPTNGDA